MRNCAPAKKFFLHAAHEIAQAQVPCNGDIMLRYADAGAKTSEFDELAEFHVVNDFHR